MEFYFSTGRQLDIILFLTTLRAGSAQSDLISFFPFLHLCIQAYQSKPWLMHELFCLWTDCQLDATREAGLIKQHAISRDHYTRFTFQHVALLSLQQTTRVSLPSACMCVRQSMLCAVAPTCWRARFPHTCRASASLPASPSPIPGHAPTPSPDVRSKNSTAAHFILVYSFGFVSLSGTARWHLHRKDNLRVKENRPFLLYYPNEYNCGWWVYTSLVAVHLKMNYWLLL